MLKISDRLCIGSANFGEKYGINNKKFNEREIIKLFKFLHRNKIFFIDTAISYKNSEKIIGKYKTKKFKIINKIKIKKNRSKIRQYIMDEVRLSLKKLNTNSIYGLLIHNVEILDDVILRKKIFSTFNYLKKLKLVKYFGLSIYDPKEFLLYNKLYKFKILQAPCSILDRRILEKKYINIINKKKILLFARSVFLKGKFNKNIKKNKINIINSLNLWLKKNKINYFEACIRFLIKNPNIYKIIIGISSLEQLVKLISYAKRGQIISPPEISGILSNKLIDTRKW